MFKDLREYLKELERRGWLARIKTPVSRDLEITEITDRVSKGPAEHNRALLFEQVSEAELPVAINLFGSPERMALALGVENLNELGDRLGALLDFRLPQGLGGMLNRGQDFLSVLRSVGLGPSLAGSGPVQEIVEKETASLHRLPILKCWPQDGGRYITLMQVITRDPEQHPQRGHVSPAGQRRSHADDALAAAQGRRGTRACGAAKTQKPPIPCAIVLGGDPAAMWCASAPLPPNIDEYLLAGYLRGKPVEFVKCVTQPIEAPANAEIVIEGYVDPNEHCPKVRSAITPASTRRSIRSRSFTSRPSRTAKTPSIRRPSSASRRWKITGWARRPSACSCRLLRLFLAGVVDYNMPAEGVFHNLVIVSIPKRFPAIPQGDVRHLGPGPDDADQGHRRGRRVT